jgi:hypothetical protein
MQQVINIQRQRGWRAERGRRAGWQPRD